MKIINKINSNKYDNRAIRTYVLFLGSPFTGNLEYSNNKIFELLNNNNFPIYNKGILTEIKTGNIHMESREIKISKWEPLGFRRNVLYA